MKTLISSVLVINYLKHNQTDSSINFEQKIQENKKSLEQKLKDERTNKLINEHQEKIGDLYTINVGPAEQYKEGEIYEHV